MITSAYFTAAFETIVHDMTREQAIKYVEETRPWTQTERRIILRKETTDV